MCVGERNAKNKFIGGNDYRVGSVGQSRRPISCSALQSQKTRNRENVPDKVFHAKIVYVWVSLKTFSARFEALRQTCSKKQLSCFDALHLPLYAISEIAMIDGRCSVYWANPLNTLHRMRAARRLHERVVNLTLFKIDSAIGVGACAGLQIGWSFSHLRDMSLQLYCDAGKSREPRLPCDRHNKKSMCCRCGSTKIKSFINKLLF